MAEASGHGERRRDIDGLRAFAILPILAYHVQPALMPGGYVGVDVVFVISGFLITGIILRERAADAFSFAEFYRRRVRRIFPALLLVLVVTLIGAALFLGPRELGRVGKHAAGAAVFIQNMVLYRESGYFDSGVDEKPLLHLWSLAVEEQFYLIWPLLIVGLTRFGGRAVRLGIAMTIALSLMACVVATSVKPSLAFYLIWSRFWELAAGGLLAAVTLDRPLPLGPRAALAAFGLALLVGSIVLLADPTHFPGWRAALPVVATALLIGTGPDTIVHRLVFENRMAVAIGFVSYPLYLWHWPLLAAATILDASLGVRFALAGLAVGLAAATYLWLETPVARAYRHARGRVVGGLAVGMVAVGLVGLVLDLTKGFLFLHPADFVRYEGFRYDGKGAMRTGICHFDAEEGLDAMHPACLAPRGASAPRDRPVVVLWGDSHAGHLLPGLQALDADGRFDLVQLTTNACPPVLSDPSLPEECLAKNRAVLDLIGRIAPDRVIMAGLWAKGTSGLAEAITATKAKIAARGGSVIVVGPVPYWRRPLPFVIAARVKAGGGIPERLGEADGLLPIGFVIEDDVKTIVAASGASLVSLVDLLCVERMCRVTADDAEKTPIAFDQHHFTTVGSTLAAAKILETAFPKGR